jgi:glycosyltransferase involved in cell wall biosynthesis
MTFGCSVMQKLRIGINLFLFTPQVGGLANYVMTLLREWNNHYPDDELILFTFEQNKTLLAEGGLAGKHRQLALQHQNEIAKLAREVDVYFCPFGTLWPRPYPKPSVITLVDVQERFFPEFFSAEDIKNRLFHYDGSIKMADHIITISEFSKRSIVDIFGIKTEKVSVSHLCDDHLPELDQRPGALPTGWDGNFLIYPANDWKHKNHARLVEAMAMIVNEHPDAKLVMTGLQENCYPKIVKQVASLNLSHAVCHLGRVSRAEVAWLYRHATLLVFPSLFEGFGIPLVEAMRSRLPIACSNTTCLPEIAGDAASFFDPYDSSDIARAITKTLNNQDALDSLCRNGLNRISLYKPELLIYEHRNAILKSLVNYKFWRYLRMQLVDFPLSMMRHPHSIPIKHKQIARMLLGKQ